MKLFKRLPRRVVATNLIGVIIVVLVAIVMSVLLSGCAPTKAEKERDEHRLATQQEAVDQVAQGATNLEPIGHHLETSGRAPEGQAVRGQVELVMGAIHSIAKTLGINFTIKTPTVSYAEWSMAKDDAKKSSELAERLGVEKEQMKASLEEKDKKLDVLEKRVQEDAKNGWWRFVANGAFWSSAAGIALWAAKLLNVPGAGILADPLLRLIGRPIIKPIEEKSQEFADRASTGATAVMASDVARCALGALEKKIDPALAATLSEAISKATFGRAKGLEDVFRMVAKGVAIDEGQHSEVDALLTEVRAEMPTTLGTPDAIAGLFKAA